MSLAKPGKNKQCFLCFIFSSATLEFIGMLEICLNVGHIYVSIFLSKNVDLFFGVVGGFWNYFTYSIIPTYVSRHTSGISR